MQKLKTCPLFSTIMKVNGIVVFFFVICQSDNYQSLIKVIICDVLHCWNVFVSKVITIWHWIPHMSYFVKIRQVHYAYKTDYFGIVKQHYQLIYRNIVNVDAYTMYTRIHTLIWAAYFTYSVKRVYYVFRYCWGMWC